MRAAYTLKLLLQRIHLDSKADANGTVTLPHLASGDYPQVEPVKVTCNKAS